MEDRRQNRQGRQDLKLLAEGILNEEVLTSQHLWYQANEDEDAWLELVISTFPFGDMVNAIVELIQDNGPRGILFYNYLENRVETTPPKFDEVFFVAGDDYRDLIDLLIELKKLRLH